MKYYKKEDRKEFSEYLHKDCNMNYRQWKKLSKKWKLEIAIDFHLWMYM